MTTQGNRPALVHRIVDEFDVGEHNPVKKTLSVSRFFAHLDLAAAIDIARLQRRLDRAFYADGLGAADGSF